MSAWATLPCTPPTIGCVRRVWGVCLVCCLSVCLSVLRSPTVTGCLLFLVLELLSPVHSLPPALCTCGVCGGVFSFLGPPPSTCANPWHRRGAHPAQPPAPAPDGDLFLLMARCPHPGSHSLTASVAPGNVLHPCSCPHHACSLGVLLPLDGGSCVEMEEGMRRRIMLGEELGRGGGGDGTGLLSSCTPLLPGKNHRSRSDRP